MVSAGSDIRVCNDQNIHVHWADGILLFFCGAAAAAGWRLNENMQVWKQHWLVSHRGLMVANSCRMMTHTAGLTSSQTSGPVFDLTKLLANFHMIANQVVRLSLFETPRLAGFLLLVETRHSKIEIETVHEM